MTFKSLAQDVRDYLAKGFSTDAQTEVRIPQFINDAERKIAIDLELQGFIEPQIFTMAAGKSVYQKPDRWRRTISMTFGTNLLGDTAGEERVPLFARSYEYCRAVWPNSTITGAPKFYADYNSDHWLIAPTPNENFRCEAIVEAIPPLLDEKNQTNWLTDHAPILLRPAVLSMAAAFNQDQAKKDLYDAEYAGVMASLNKKDLLKIVDRSATRRQA